MTDLTNHCRKEFMKWIEQQEMPCDIPMAFAAWNAAWEKRSEYTDD
jgi:hypothetical protein